MAVKSWLFWVSGLVVAVLWIAWIAQYPIVNYFVPGWTIADRGQWGDTFGALSSLFSAAAFLGAVYAIRQQQAQIEQARLDQERTNQEAREEQHRQRFESSYFELLRLLRESRDAVRFRHGVAYAAAKHPQQAKPSLGSTLARQRIRSSSTGTDAFIAAWREFRFFADKGGDNPTRDEIREIYDKSIHGRHESSFGPYFRLLYTMFDRIENDRVLTPDEKDRYGRMLRSQLTSYEIALAGLNGLSSVSKDFDRLIISFRLLKYLPEGTRRRTLARYYPDETFQARD